VMGRSTLNSGLRGTNVAKQVLQSGILVCRHHVILCAVSVCENLRRRPKTACEDLEHVHLSEPALRPKK
jgi:hypothetical protein